MNNLVCVFAERINRWAELQTDALAVQHGDISVSYGRLRSLVSHRIAYLQTNLADNSPVVLAMNPGVDYIVCVLACLVSRRAFIPVTENQISNRLSAIVHSSGAVAVVTDAALKPIVNQNVGINVSILDSTSATGVADDYAELNPEPYDNGADTAYIIPTSGSTGTPKLVQGSHTLLAEFIDWEVENLGLASDVRVGALTAISFDVSLRDLLVPIFAGGTLCIADPQTIRSPGRLIEWLAAQSISLIHLVPTLARILCDAADESPAAKLPNLEFALFAGEPLTGRDVRAWRERISPESRLFNVYGPSETTLAKVVFEVTDSYPDEAVIPLGNAIVGTKIRICNPDHRELTMDVGCIGEIVIRIARSCAGYLGDDIRTRRQFDYHDHGCSYFTGDLGYLDPEGLLHYSGRKDGQIKINGQRVELAEIEAALRAIPGVRQAVANPYELPSGGSLVAGYLVAQNIPAPNAIRDQLLKALPEHMLPSRFILIDELPMTESGKVSRRDLPAPDSSRPEQAQLYVPAETTTQQTLCQILGQKLGIDRIGVRDNFFDLGGTSLIAMSFIADIERAFPSQALPVATFFDLNTVERLAGYLDATEVEREKPKELNSAKSVEQNHDIAIIGMAGRFPGADTVEDFWQLLKDGVESITHFNLDDLDPSLDEGTTTAPNYVPARGVISGAKQFDADFFGFRPREAELLDPAQRILLETAWQALEDANYAGERMTDRRVGVFAGVGDNGYLVRNILSNASLVNAVGEHQIRLANEKDYVASRIAYKLDLTGPAISVHTACSTSLVAVAQAVEALRAGRCSMALAGGAFVATPQRSGYLHTEGGFASADGHCRPFDAKASGTVFSSGAGMVLLKPLHLAKRDKDQVVAIVKGVGTNNDGAQRVSFMAPSVTGQSSCISAALSDAGLQGEEIGYVEAHGTATPVGDPIEVEALARAYGTAAASEPIRLGSLKGNIGHLDAAAGITGLIKAALMLKYRQIPASINFEHANPSIDFPALGFRVQCNTEAWPDSIPARASVSSFGVGGTNAHVVLTSAEAAVQTDEEVAAVTNNPVRLHVSARSTDALERQCAHLSTWLTRNKNARLNDLAYTLDQGRARLPYRRTVFASSLPEAITNLSRNVPAAQAQPGSKTLAFAFPGQGAQRPGMVRQLYAQSDVARKVIDSVADAAEPLVGMDIRDLLLSSNPDERLNETRYTQVCLFAAELASARFFLSLGVQPDVLVGHSIGEFAAACVSGLFTTEQATRLVSIRGRLMQALPRGSMAAIGLSASSLRERLPETLALAADNAPTLCVAAGPSEDLQAFTEMLSGEGVFVRPLNTSHAFHSPMMNDMLSAFAAEFAQVDYGQMTIPIVSTLTGKKVDRDELAGSDYWLKHISESVLYREAIDTISRDSNLLLFEVGPGQNLSALSKQIAGNDRAIFTATSNELALDETDWDAALRALTTLDGSGVPVHWDSISSNPDGKLMPLPPYPFSGPTYWLEPTRQQDTRDVTGEESSAQTSPLRQLLEAVSGIDLSGDNRFREFVELGFDSLLLTQVGQALASRFGTSISLKELMQTTNSLDKLIAHIGEADSAKASTERLSERSVLEPVTLDPPTADAKIGLTENNRPCWFRRTRQDTYHRIGADFFVKNGKVAWDGNRQEDNTRAVTFTPALFGEIATVAPLTKAQREIWLTEQLGGEEVDLAFIEAASIALSGPLDLVKLQSAIDAVSARHEALRGQVDNDGHLFSIRHKVDLKLEILDASGISENSASCEQRVLEWVSQAFNLNSAPLVRFAYMKFSDSDHLLIFAGHHIVLDGYSKGTILEELGQLYEFGSSDLAQNGLPPADAFSDYAQARGDGSDDALAWWLNAYEIPASTIDLPVDRPRQLIRSYRAGRKDVELPQSTLHRLRETAAEQNASLFAVLLAGFSMTLARISRQNDLIIGVPASGQVDSGALKLVGHCVNFLPFRIWVDSKRTVSEHLCGVSDLILDANVNQRFTFGELAERISFDRLPSRPPLVSVMFNVDQAPHDFSFGDSLTVRYVELPKSHQNMELSVNCNVRSDRIVIECGFNSDLFDERTIGHWMESFAQILSSLPSYLDSPLSEIPILSEASSALVLGRWGQCDAQSRWQSSFVESIWQQAALQPARIAVCAGTDVLTYAQLTNQADQLAIELERIGLTAGKSRIGVCVHRGVNMLVSVLGVLRTGAAYVPLDPNLPQERLNYMTEDAGLTILISDNGGISGTQTTPILRVDKFNGLLGNLEFNAPSIDPGWPAYVIYTSGSTGKPKGVVLQHSCVANFLSSMTLRPGMASSDVMLAVTTLSFDISVLELYLPLTSGARVVIADRDELIDGDALINLMESHNITVMQATPATWRLLLDAGWNGRSTLRALCGGEAMPKDLAYTLLQNVDSLWNMYGPTETTVWSSVARIKDAMDVNIGTPIHETSVYVLDSNMMPVPVGVPGEMYIGGAGVAAGYLDRPKLTSERFVSDPFTSSGNESSRLYRTGDEVRWRHDGCLEYFNRLDNQVKLRGFRIELGEIEAALNALDEIEESAVVVYEADSTAAQLVAYAASASTLSVPNVRKALRTFLPEYMIPSQILSLAELPKTPNGKIDRNSLPAPSIGGPRTVSEPATVAEKYVAEIWRDLIASSTLQLDVSDNFFEQGGHSLLAARFVTRVRREQSIEIPVRELVLKTLGQISQEYLEDAMHQPPKPGMLKRLVSAFRTTS